MEQKTSIANKILRKLKKIPLFAKNDYSKSVKKSRIRHQQTKKYYIFSNFWQLSIKNYPLLSICLKMATLVITNYLKL